MAMRTRFAALSAAKPGLPNAKPAQIFISDDRDDTSTTPIDMAALHRTILTTREIIGYPTYDVSLTLIDDDYMRELNEATRGVGAPTDVLSFCFQDNFVKPGVLGDVQFDVGDFYNLGDMVVDVDYVKRRCEEDRELHEKEGRLGGPPDKGESVAEGEVISEKVDSNHEPEEDDEEGEYEYIEVEVDEYDDRGVAPAMQYVYDPEVRIHMLVVHGMLHLVGYDHIEDDDYELMVVKEDEVLAELKSRLGKSFGLTKALPEG
ncbi:hypothetical protein ACHAXT_005559 [Thalassiosira profunda]